MPRQFPDCCAQECQQEEDCDSAKTNEYEDDKHAAINALVVPNARELDFTTKSERSHERGIVEVSEVSEVSRL